VSDYADTSVLQRKFAAAAGVDSALVKIDVAPGSVVITATIAVPTGTASALVQSSLATNIGTTTDASAALGVTVESAPTILIASPPPPPPPSPPIWPHVAKGSLPPPPPPPSPPIWPKVICAAESDIESPNSSNSGISNVGIVGIAIGCLLTGGLIGSGLVFMKFRWSPIIKRHKSFDVDVVQRVDAHVDKHGKEEEHI
jgi:hypothetical protein